MILKVFFSLNNSMILQHKEVACCLAQRFRDRKAAPLALAGWGTNCLLWHGQGWLGISGYAISDLGRGTHLCSA